MTQKQNFRNLDELSKRMEIIMAGRLKRKDKIEKAVKIQDSLSEKSGSWKGSEEIRKWRETR